MRAVHRTARPLSSPLHLLLAAGLATALVGAEGASGISRAKFALDVEAWSDVPIPARDPQTGEIIPGMFENVAITGSNTTVGILEGAPPFLDHVAFEGLTPTRIWYPFVGNSDQVNPVRRDPQTAGPAFQGQNYLHGTAVAGAILARNESFEPPGSFFGPATGVAPGAQLLAAGLASNSGDGSGFEDVSPETVLFTLAAMADLDIDHDGEGDFIEPLAEWYGVEPWEPATVANFSFGQSDFLQDRAGESEVSRVVDMMAFRTNMTIVAAAGNFGEDPDQETREEDEGTMAAPGASFNTIAVGYTESGEDIESLNDDSSFGPVPIFNWLTREADRWLTMADGTDFADLNFGGMDDPRAGMETMFPEGGGDEGRPGVDIVAPGTDLLLPGDFISGSLSPVGFYSGWTGSSYSAAIVTGAVALMHDFGKQSGRSIAPVVTRAVLLNSAFKPSGWNNFQSAGEMAEMDVEITNLGLDPEFGAGLIDFDRLLVQYLGTRQAGGYADLTPENSFIMQDFGRPLLARKASIDPQTGELTHPFDFFDRNGDDQPDTVEQVIYEAGDPRTPTLAFRSSSSYTADDVLFFYTDPKIPMITRFDDPPRQAGAGGLRQSRATRTPGVETEARRDSDGDDAGAGGDGEASRPSGFMPLMAAPFNNGRFEFEGVGGGGNGGGGVGGAGDRQSAPPTGFAPGTPGGTGDLGRPGGGGGGGETPGGLGFDLDPCESPRDTACQRTGWDHGRLGIGELELPLGVLPENTEIILTLAWQREDSLADEVYEELLNGVLSAPSPAGGGVRDGASLRDDAGEAPSAETRTREEGRELKQRLRERRIPSRTMPGWNEVPLLATGINPENDEDWDGVDDGIDNCVAITRRTDPMGAPIRPFDGVPSGISGMYPFAQDSYNPVIGMFDQTDLVDADGDGVCAPADPNDGDVTVPAMPTVRPPAMETQDSERLRRVTDEYPTTASEILNIDPTALNGVVAIRVNVGGGEFVWGSGVLIDEQAVLTAAHLFSFPDPNTGEVDNVPDVNPGSVTIYFFQGPGLPPFPYVGTDPATGEPFRVNEIRIHPSFGINEADPENVFQNQSDDLAILRLIGDATNLPMVNNTSFSGPIQVYPIADFMEDESDFPAAGDEEVFIAGWGDAADGRFGETAQDQDNPEQFFTAVDEFGSTSPILRSGKNQLDRFILDDDVLVDDGNARTEFFLYDFDHPTDPSFNRISGVSDPSSLGNRIETTIMRGDSGGPALVHNDANMDGNVDPGELEIFGVHSVGMENGDPIGSFGTIGQGAVADAYVGTDADGNTRFITSVLTEPPPTPPGIVQFQDLQPAKLARFKGDIVQLELVQRRFDGGPDRIIARSASESSNVQHIRVEEVEEVGDYYLRMKWQRSAYNYAGFLFDIEMNPGFARARRVRPLNDNQLDVSDIIPVFPADVEYGVAWWADLPRDRSFEGLRGDARTSLVGDMNHNGKVDASDIGELIALWGTSGPRGDLNGDGVVDRSDLLTQIANYTGGE